MTVIRKIVLESNDDMIDKILEKLHNECDHWANELLVNAGLDDLEWDEYEKYESKLVKEIFNDVMARMIFDSKAE